MPTKPTPKKRPSTAITRSTNWKPKFLARLRDTANIRASCKAANIDRDTAYEHRKKDLAFAKKWRAALGDACDALESSAWKRARFGVKRTHSHFYQGEMVGQDTITEYSDTLLIFLLKAHRPKKYRERYSVEIGLTQKLRRKMNELGITEEQIRRNATLAPIFARAGII